MTDETIRHYTEVFDEENRLDDRLGPFEFLRTKSIITRYLNRQQLIIVDVGGGSGAYSLWLAEQGHQVHFLDLVPRQVDMVRRKARDRSLILASADSGSAESLPFEDEFADMVLLMGPLYHLSAQENRLKALRECARVVKKGGRVLCTAISRFASMLAGFRFNRFDDPAFEAMGDGDLLDGQHRNPVPGSKHLGSAFLHKPAELRQEIEGADLRCEKILGIESPIALLRPLEDWVQQKGRMYELAVKYAHLVEEEENLLGASFHLLGVGLRP
jgi:2-polyprenyl-3-methyl-5-hydroxy-6-metoxy-1,4-benzoquinol methylase